MAVDLEELFVIAISEEVAEFIDEIPDFAGVLDLLLNFHVFSPKATILRDFSL